MLKSVRAVARFLQNTIGWNRIGLILSITIISVAGVVLFHMLRDIDTNEVIAALKATEPHHIAAAAFFVACGYFTLTFYDWFALRTIGREEVPYRIAALTGFTSYSIGHNIGATVFTGGAVRYRIYSTYGLDAIEVAKICFIAGLTFWLGNATVLGLGVAYHPQAAVPIDQLPPWLNRTIAIGILVVLMSYVSWVWSAPREIGQGEWKVHLPSGPSTLLQICIGILDLGFCALAMYMIQKVAYRAARAGMVTGVLLAVARISGETAPLLFTALNNQFWSTNLNAPVASLPVVIFQFALSPYHDWQKLAWTGALIITLAVLALSIIARILAAQRRSS